MNTPSDNHFDAALRQTWRDAAAHVPGPLQLQLSPAIAAQHKASQSQRKHWCLPAAGAFASMALAFGLWWSPSFNTTSPETSAPIAQIAADAGLVIAYLKRGGAAHWRPGWVSRCRRPW